MRMTLPAAGSTLRNLIRKGRIQAQGVELRVRLPLAMALARLAYYNLKYRKGTNETVRINPN